MCGKMIRNTIHRKECLWLPIQIKPPIGGGSIECVINRFKIHKFKPLTLFQKSDEEKESVKIVAVDLQAMAPLPGVIQIQVNQTLNSGHWTLITGHWTIDN